MGRRTSRPRTSVRETRCMKVANHTGKNDEAARVKQLILGRTIATSPRLEPFAARWVARRIREKSVSSSATSTSPFASLERSRGLRRNSTWARSRLQEPQLNSTRALPSPSRG